jgi:hypothetical protein
VDDAMTTTPDLATIHAPPDEDALMTYMIQKLASYGVPTTDWNAGSWQLTALEREHLVGLEFLGPMILELAKTGWVDSAKADFLTQVAHSMWGIDRVKGTPAQQVFTLVNGANTGPHSLTAGDLFRASDGKLYRPVTTGTIAKPGSLLVTALAVAPGLARGLVTSMVDPLPGVTITNPAFDIVGGLPVRGTDDESDVSLLARCLATWPDLTVVRTQSRVERWVRASNATITRVKLAATGFPNEVAVTIGSPSGGVSGAIVTAAQAYVNARRPITRLYPVQSATTLPVDAGGKVIVPRGRLADIQVAANAAWNTYLTTTAIGSFVILEKLIQIVRDAGAIDFYSATLGSNPTVPMATADLALGSTQVPITSTAAPGGLANQLTWYEA